MVRRLFLLAAIVAALAAAYLPSPPSMADSVNWDLTGNSGTTAGTNFLGTTDNTALEIKVFNFRALRFEPNAECPNIIGGGSSNIAGNYAGTTTDANYATVAGGSSNIAYSYMSAVGGGY